MALLSAGEKDSFFAVKSINFSLAAKGRKAGKKWKERIAAGLARPGQCLALACGDVTCRARGELHLKKGKHQPVNTSLIADYLDYLLSQLMDGDKKPEAVVSCFVCLCFCVFL